jgi:hypothetical protein
MFASLTLILTALLSSSASAATPTHPLPLPKFYDGYRRAIELVLSRAAEERDALLDRMIQSHKPLEVPSDVSASVATAAVALAGIREYASTHYGGDPDLHATLENLLGEFAAQKNRQSAEKQVDTERASTRLVMGAPFEHLDFSTQPVRKPLLSASRRFFVSQKLENGKLTGLDIGDLATGRLLRRITGLKGRGVDSVTSPTRDEIYVLGDRMNDVQVWDLATGKSLRRTVAKPGNAWSSESGQGTLQISPDGRQIAFFEENGLRVLDADSLQDIKLEKFARPTCFAFADEPGKLAILEESAPLHQIAFYDTGTGARIGAVPSTDRGVTTLAYSPSQHRLVEMWNAGKDIMSVRVRDLEASAGGTVHSLGGYFDLLTPDGRFALGSSGMKPEFRVADLLSGRKFSGGIPIPADHGTELSLSADGKTLAVFAGPNDRVVRTWLWAYDFAQAIAEARPAP